MNTFLGAFNFILAILLLVLGVLVWFTASTLFSIIFGVVLLILGLSMTGVLGEMLSYFNRK